MGCEELMVGISQILINFHLLLNRYTSLIHADGLEDVAIVGNNGTVDGNGKVDWSTSSLHQLFF